MIDALAAVIKRISSDNTISTLCSNRVAPKHKYSNKTMADAWKTPAKGIEVRYDPGGVPDIYSTIQNVRLLVACYGEDEYEASRLYSALVWVTRTSDRVVVTTANGQALIYWILQDGTPEQQFDLDINMPYLRVFLTARVAETAVT